ncbi:MAG: O-antigen ligase family protein [Candidatus Campbellbacteria bacterium]|nr:O-antigen ligase family protein [Candidatus Campbellbacteria bacterium]
MKNVQQKMSLMGIITTLCILVFPFVVSRHLVYGGTNAKFFFVDFVFSVIFFLSAYLLVLKKHTILLQKRWLLGALFVTVVFFYLSVFFGVFPEASLWSDILRSSGLFFLSFVALFAFCASEMLTVRDWSMVRRTIAVSSGLFALLTYFSANGLGVIGRLFTINFEIQGLTFTNTTFAGAYLLIALLVTAIEWTRSEKRSRARYVFGTLVVVQMLSPLLFGERIWRGLQGVSGLLSDPVNILGAARASSVTMFLVVLCCVGLMLIHRFVTVSYKARASWVWSALIFVGVFSAIGLLFVPGSIVQEKYVEQSSAARIIVWEEGFRAFAERPLLGWGPENFRFAHEQYFDSRLYSKENLGEVWFDRAHNVVVDTLVTVGILGALSILLLVGFFLRTIFCAHRVGLIGYGEACLLAILPFAHFLQLQTAFDTVSTYTILGILLGYGLWLEKETVALPQPSKNVPEKYALLSKSIGVALMLAGIFGFWVLVGKEYGRQKALFQIFDAKDTATQIEHIEKALSRRSNFEAMRLASASLISGSFDFIPKTALEKQGEVLGVVLKQLDAYGVVYKTYLEIMPTDYRAHMSYAYLLMVETVYGKNRLEEARQEVEMARPLSPGNPLTPVMDALVTLYAGDIVGARLIMKESLGTNPDIVFSQEVADYIEKQAKQFPVISVLKLKNL